MKNKPAVFGLIIILIAHFIAVTGYLLMPDKTPDANDGSALIKKKSPGFEATLLKFINNREIEKVNFFKKVFMGQESEYTIHPVTSYEVNGWDIVYTPIGSRTLPDTIPLIKAVRHLFVGANPIFKSQGKGNYFVKGDLITYLGQDEKLHSVTRAALLEEFKDKCVENRTYLLGTDKSGRDILSRLLFGTRISLSIGFISVLISLFVGVVIGALGGYFGGMTDKVAIWLMTVVWSIPGIMLVIAISLAVQSKGIWVAFVAVGLTMWVEVARVVRGQIMVIKQKLYVEAATALGIGNLRIIFVHILPNLMGPLIVIATANFASAILIEAGLSFLGLGVQPPMPSWGMMVSEGYNSNWEGDGGYLVLLPSLCISLLVLSFNLFGNGLRDAYDPQTAIKW